MFSIPFDQLAPSNLSAYANKLWPNFTLVSYAIYTKEIVYLYNHPTYSSTNHYVKLPWSKEFQSCTIILYKNEPTAIVDLDVIENQTELIAVLLHELFHGYQHIVGENRFPNELIGISYPLENKNLTLRMVERKTLFDAYKEKDQQKKQTLLSDFYHIRQKRLAIIGEENLSYETSLETVEGPAFYIEYKMYDAFSDLAEKAVLTKYSHSLLDTEDACKHIRRSCYSSGLLLCLLLDQLNPDWKNSFFSIKMSLYNYFSTCISILPQTIPLPSYREDIDRIIATIQAEKEAEFEAYDSQKGYHILIYGEINIRGMDPMNIVSLDNKKLHKHFLKVSLCGKEFLFQQPVITYSKAEKIVKVHFILPHKPTITSNHVFIPNVGEITGNIIEKEQCIKLYL